MTLFREELGKGWGTCPKKKGQCQLSALLKVIKLLLPPTVSRRYLATS